VVDETPRGDAALSPAEVIVIDREACMGSGNCGYWAPNVFDLDDDGIAIVIGDLAGNEELVRVALENCPTSAIRLAGD
jgi:ferredoxin